MDYRKEVMRTAGASIEGSSFETQLSLAGLGIAGEAGEVADLIKKVLHHEKPLDKNKLIGEMGDVFWYLEYLCAVLGVSREEVWAINSAKLRKRFPDGFNTKDANERKDEKTN
jgi:NTP pyrophosphatase (non-canonical NTP hydrolase)